MHSMGDLSTALRNWHEIAMLQYQLDSVPDKLMSTFTKRYHFREVTKMIGCLYYACFAGYYTMTYYRTTSQLKISRLIYYPLFCVFKNPIIVFKCFFDFLVTTQAYSDDKKSIRCCFGISNPLDVRNAFSPPFLHHLRMVVLL